MSSTPRHTFRLQWGKIKVVRSHYGDPEPLNRSVCSSRR